MAEKKTHINTQNIKKRDKITQATHDSKHTEQRLWQKKDTHKHTKY